MKQTRKRIVTCFLKKAHKKNDIPAPLVDCLGSARFLASRASPHLPRHPLPTPVPSATSTPLQSAAPAPVGTLPTPTTLSYSGGALGDSVDPVKQVWVAPLPLALDGPPPTLTRDSWPWQVAPLVRGVGVVLEEVERGRWGSLAAGGCRD